MGNDLTKADYVPDLLEELKVLVRKGIPVFTQDFNQLGADIFLSMYHTVKAQLTNPHVVFPHNAQSLLSIDWLVDSDDFGVGRYGDIHLVNAHYQRGSEDNDYQTQIKIKEYDFIVLDRLSSAEVLKRWQFMKEILPQEFEKYNVDFDILEWYLGATFGQF